MPDRYISAILSADMHILGMWHTLCLICHRGTNIQIIIGCTK